MEGRDEPAYNTIEFYARDIRALQIRDYALRVGRAADRLMYDSQLESQDRLSLYTELEDLNGKLIDLGVFRMKDSNYIPKEACIDPLINAMWYGERVVGMTGIKYVNITSLGNLDPENNRRDRFTVNRFRLEQMMVDFIYHCFGAAPEERHKRPNQ